MKAHGQTSAGGFTLVELLVVVALVAGLAVFLITGLSENKTAALQSSQAAVANLVSVARTRAMASGRPARVLINVDDASKAEPKRFLRHVVVQTQVDEEWRTIADAYLPAGVYVVPGNFSAEPAGLFAASDAGFWVRGNGSAPLRSTALRANMISTETIVGTAAERWVSFSFAASGTTAQAGDVVIALGRERPPGTFSPGESPVELTRPDSVRGVTMSVYGMTAMINDRASF